MEQLQASAASGSMAPVTGESSSLSNPGAVSSSTTATSTWNDFMHQQPGDPKANFSPPPPPPAAPAGDGGGFFGGVGPFFKSYARAIPVNQTLAGAGFGAAIGMLLACGGPIGIVGGLFLGGAVGAVLGSGLIGRAAGTGSTGGS